MFALDTQPDDDLRLLAALPIGVFTIDPSGRCTFANEFWETFLGRPAADLMGFGYLDSVHPDDRGSLETRWQAIQERSDAYRMEYRFVTADGSIRWVLMEGRPTYEAGELTGFVGALTDIEDQKRAARLESKLHHAQKMEAVGTLAGGVAHDFNNLLSAVLTSLQIALSKGNLAPPIAEALRIAMNASEQASELARQLLMVSRGREAVVRPANVNAVVEQTLALMRRSLPPGTQLEVDLDPTVGLAQVDSTQLAQAVLNLTINAGDALASGGTIRVSTRRAPMSDFGQRGGEAIVIQVDDDGFGIESDAMEHLFEPFFTTKADKGTGLGLAMVNALATSHGGWVDVESVPGEGSSFAVVLPLVPVRPSQTDPRMFATHVGDELVVLLQTTGAVDGRHALQAAGYEVLEVNGVDGALEVLREHGDRVAVFIAQLMGGARELIGRLREMGAEQPVVLAANYADSAVEGRLKQAGFAGVVPIPFDPATLTRVVRAAIDG